MISRRARGLGVAVQVSVVLIIAYIMLSGPAAPAPGSGYVVCRPTGFLFMPEDCLTYSGPDFEVPDDL